MTQDADPSLEPRCAPPYFERIRLRAAERWKQLEADPELAGPWHQLFKQVQSPRHILSELLQNADDAGATEARVFVENGQFVFEHNGGDFEESHFASICRFGYSNKRALHTIGFRGIGFKSTFSLGDTVELRTPTLAVSFRKQRFTEPHWLQNEPPRASGTGIRVAILNDLLRREVEKNLDEWVKSPLSLLFFRSIRCLQVREHVVRWNCLGPGPVPDSQWMSLDGAKERPCLLVRSLEECFPPEALEEIRQERMLGADDAGEFPPSRIEIVLGTAGRLHVVLPTGVQTELPFACNAPFIQDPARLKIKDPETSPTNRWLLRRAGELAARAMLAWLGNRELGLQDRADAYALMPDVDREATSLEGACAAQVEVAFADSMEAKPPLLTDGGDLAEGKGAVLVPMQVLNVWPAEQALALLDKTSRPALCRLVSVANQSKLSHWGLVDEVTKAQVIECLRRQHFPKPASWRQLLRLWEYLAPDMTGYLSTDPAKVRILPVQGQDVLYSASEVVRLSEKKLLQSEDDWEFLAGRLIVLNQNWTRFLADFRREREGGEGDGGESAEAALAVLKRVGLTEASDVSAVIEQVSGQYFSQGQVKLADCVRLAQIAAKLNANIGPSFRYACKDRRLRAIGNAVLYDEDGSLEDMLPNAFSEARILHGDYSESFYSCTRDDWIKWVASGRAGLHTFVPFVERKSRIYSKTQLVAEAKRRGMESEPYYSYVTSEFILEDWDFDQDCWQHWEQFAIQDDGIWGKVAGRILQQRDSFWSKSGSARIAQVATTGSTRAVFGSMLTTWLLKLAERKCLPDTRGYLHLPSDLLRRTPETESLMDVEPFVDGLLDRESTRPLLEGLGVRHSPTGPSRLLDRLRTLARSERVPTFEVEKWYRRLDQMLNTCSTEEAQDIKDAFRREKLLLAHDGSWVTAGSAFLVGDEEDVPGAALVRPSVADLSLWRRVGVADRPSVDLALAWLSSLESGSALSTDDVRRVRTLLARYPSRIWNECGHWPNLLNEWMPTASLSFSLGMQSLFKWSHLHDWVKRKTADFQKLSGDVFRELPFSEIESLASKIEERFDEPTLFEGAREQRDWLVAFGRELARIELPSSDETEKTRENARQLSDIVWVAVPKLEVVPYLEGVPAGVSRVTDALWVGNQLLIGPLSSAKLAKRIPEELGKMFNADIRAAIGYAYERTPDAIKAYLEENFTLGPEVLQPADAAAEEVGLPADPDDAASPEPAAPANPTPDPAEVPPSEEILQVESVGLEVSAPPPDEAPATEEFEQGAEKGGEGRQRPRSKPPTPGLMERFALGLGFKLDGDGRYFHTNGGWISRVPGGKFPWEHRTATGEILKHYFPKDHCLERESLQIEADIWGMVDQKPELYSLVLSDPDGAPIELTGSRLRALKEKGEMTIHPATYRLVYDLDRKI